MDIQLEAYNGPLELLLKLIEKNEVDIYNIPIASIADQYLEQIELMRPAEAMESISGFLPLAAELLEIKSKMLLPKPPAEDEEDPRIDLAHRLEEYRQYKRLAEMFRDAERPGEYIFLKSPEKNDEWLGTAKHDPAELLNGLSAERLYGIFAEVLKRRELRTDKVRSGFNAIAKDAFSVEDKISYINKLLAGQKRIGFLDIFDSCGSRAEQVVTFLALLELVKQNKVSASQDGNFGDIVLRRVE
jgi:segregation and condensation protein A